MPTQVKILRFLEKERVWGFSKMWETAMRKLSIDFMDPFVEAHSRKKILVNGGG